MEASGVVHPFKGDDKFNRIMQKVRSPWQREDHVTMSLKSFIRHQDPRKDPKQMEFDLPPRFQHECAISECESDFPEPNSQRAGDHVGSRVRHQDLLGWGTRKKRRRRRK